MDYKIVVTKDGRIKFLKHGYFMLYRIVDSEVFVDNIFHDLQDYENKIY